MNSASVESSPSLADASCDRLQSLLLRTASIAAGRICVELRADLAELINHEPAFSVWLSRAWARFERSSGRQADSDCTSGGNSHGEWHNVTAWLPEVVSHAGVELPCTDPLKRSLILSAAHLAVRTRALEANFAGCLEKQKRDALYQLVYGLSHELNNPLANIATRAGVLFSRAQSEEDRRLLQVIVDSAMRGSEMLGDLLLVARPPELNIRPVNLGQFASEIRQQVERYSESQHVRFDWQWPADELESTVDIDAESMTECLWALIRNAIEASPEGGVIALTLRFEGSELYFYISDEGPGLSAEALTHCKDPYYSGREAGRGLGLGLSKAERIVCMHGGRLTLENLSQGGCRAIVGLARSSGKQIPR